MRQQSKVRCLQWLAVFAFGVFCMSTAQAAIKSQIIEYRQGDTLLEGYLSYDDSFSGKRPGVLVIHTWTGVGDYIKGRADMLARMGGTPLGDPPPCLRPPETDPAPVVQAPKPVKPQMIANLPPPPNAPAVVVTFVNLVAPEYKLSPALVLALMAAESNFDPLAQSPKNAQGLMQLLPSTAAGLAKTAGDTTWKLNAYHYRIKGYIDLLPGARVTDFMNDARGFIALTEAEVWEVAGRQVFAAPFLNLNRDHVQIITPDAR